MSLPFPKTPARKLRQIETKVQKGVVVWLKQLEDEGLLTFKHTPNGGKRTAATGALMKALGTRAGWPDVDIFLHDPVTLKPRHVFMIEFKAPGGELADSQKELFPKLRDRGWTIHEVTAGCSVDAILQLKPILISEGVQL